MTPTRVAEMNDRNRRKIHWSIIFLLIAASSILIRLLKHYNFDKSALLYVGIPFLIALSLLWVDRSNAKGNWKKRYFNLVVLSLIVMLGSSVILFEGFVCVVMFMPIYFLVILLAFVFRYLAERYRNRKNGQLFSHILPFILVLSAFEGSHPQLSLDRFNQVVVTKIINANVSEIRKNLTKPIDLQKERPWLLELFPMPHRVEAGTFNVGDIHEVHFVYHRWFVTNTHRGSMRLQISESDNHSVNSRFISDSSYISSYLELKELALKLEPINATQTKVSLLISFQRSLDPAWYFDPIQQYAVRQCAEFIIAEVMERR